MTIKEFVKKFIPPVFLSAYHYNLALLGAFLYGFPGKDKNIEIIGVTGTSGKSTTVDFITRILEESGARVASISSIRFKLAEKEWENKYKMTMPGRFVIQKFLRRAKNAECKYVVLEVTSEGIKQFRHKFINFDTAVFTNLGREHLESHGGFENYRNAKVKLFKATKNTHVINSDDENAKYFLDIPVKKKITFSVKDAEGIEPTKDGTLFKIQNTEGPYGGSIRGCQIKIPLIGEFNVYNALVAILVAQNYGISLDVCAKALGKAKAIPGRMEIIAKEPFMVVIDYAHTPEQLESVYKTFKNKPMVCVLGSCGGGRDKWKRPVLGKIAAKYCKEIVITNEDPYDENPLSIMDEIESGFSQIQNPKSKIQKILNRKEAIKKAIQLAKPGDIVIITGKGSEPWMCVVNGKKIPWDDRQIAKQELGIV